MMLQMHAMYAIDVNSLPVKSIPQRQFMCVRFRKWEDALHIEFSASASSASNWRWLISHTGSLSDSAADAHRTRSLLRIQLLQRCIRYSAWLSSDSVFTFTLNTQGHLMCCQLRVMTGKETRNYGKSTDGKVCYIHT